MKNFLSYRINRLNRVLVVKRKAVATKAVPSRMYSIEPFAIEHTATKTTRAYVAAAEYAKSQRLTAAYTVKPAKTIIEVANDSMMRKPSPLSAYTTQTLPNRVLWHIVNVKMGAMLLPETQTFMSK